MTSSIRRDDARRQRSPMKMHRTLLESEWRISQITGNIRHAPTEVRMRIAVLLLEGCMESSVIGISDLLGLANFVMRQLGKETRFQFATLSADGKPVRTSRGLRF